MEVYDCIASRRSIRKYQSTPISWDLTAKILDAGRMAPSAGNLQNWKFIVVQDEEKKKKIAEACLQQLWMAEAPVHIVIVAELKPSERYYGSRGERLYAVQNCAAAAENMSLMATNLGLGSCWIGAFDERMVGNAVGLPGEVRPQVVLTVGYPDEEPSEPSKYPIENVCYFNGWRGKIKDVPGYLGYTSVKIMKGAGKSKAAVQKSSEKIAAKAKEIGKKITEKIKEKQKKQKKFKEFKKIYGLK